MCYLGCSRHRSLTYRISLPMTRTLAILLFNDVEVLDSCGPKLNGYDACRRIPEQPWSKGTVIVALTGWAQEDHRRSPEAGFDHHLVKPPEPKAVESVLAGLKSAGRKANQKGEA